VFAALRLTLQLPDMGAAGRRSQIAFRTSYIATSCGKLALRCRECRLGSYRIQMALITNESTEQLRANN
jgi:hypothetical protein